MPGAERRAGELLRPEWAAIFQPRVGQMMDTYRQGGGRSVYWLTVPTPRDPARQPIARRGQRRRSSGRRRAVRRRGPRDRHRRRSSRRATHYRDAMDVDGKQTIVRESDGIHLNEAGSSLAADVVLEAVDQDFDY